MDISEIVSSDYPEYSSDTKVSKLVGTFADPSIKGVIVTNDGEFQGVVTRRQLATSHHQPNQTLKSIVRNVPRLAPDEDVRKVARMMIDSDAQLLPVFDGQQLVGVVTSDDVLEQVQPYLDAATVEEAYSGDLVTIDPDSKFAEALNILRENRFTHLPVVEDDDAVGILSLYDVTGVTVRATEQSQGGDAGGMDPYGGEISDRSARTHRGGYGAREGERERILDMPVRDVMVSPVRTITPERTLEDAVEAMFDADASSLVVERDDRPVGIVTKTDVLDSLTWEAGGNRSVQVYGSEYLEDVTHEAVVRMVDKFDERDGGMNVLDAKIHLHEHDEKKRGTPLLLARIRIYTDRGLFIASGEGYGAKHALNEARDVMERRIRDDKTQDKNKKPPSEEYWDKRFGWWLES